MDDEADAAVDEAVVCVAFEGTSDGGSSGLHGECEPTDVLDDAANGTPVDEYKSWLNCELENE